MLYVDVLTASFKRCYLDKQPYPNNPGVSGRATCWRMLRYDRRAPFLPCKVLWLEEELYAPTETCFLT